MDWARSSGMKTAGMARRAVPVAERGVRRRNGFGARGRAGSVLHFVPGGDAAARRPYHGLAMDQVHQELEMSSQLGFWSACLAISSSTCGSKIFGDQLQDF